MSNFDSDLKNDSHPDRRRRDFLKRSAVMGAGLVVGGGAAAEEALAGAPLPALYGYGGLAPIAVVEDAARLVRAGDSVGEAVSGVLEMSVNHEIPGNAALLGGMAPLDPASAADLIDRNRNNWSARDEEDATVRVRLAAGLGWLMHDAARAHLKPLHQGAEEPRPGLYPSEVQIYHDAAVLRERAQVPAAGSGEHVGRVGSLLEDLTPRMGVRFHTFIPDYDDGSGWIRRLSGWRSEKERLLHRLAEAYQDPDSELLERYVTGPNLYDGDDPAIGAARALARNEEPASGVEDAVAETSGEASLYARCLRDGYRAVEAAGAYFAEEISREEFLSRIG